MLGRSLSAAPLALVLFALSNVPAAAQTFPTDDAVIRAIWQEGTQNSQVQRLTQVLADSIGPRLTGSPGQDRAHDWAVGQYRAWGVEASNEQYGTWRQWRRGISHIHLMSPRVRSLDGMLLAWSHGTGGSDIEGPAVLLPDVANRAAFDAWLPQVRGRWVLIDFPQPTCRPDAAWQVFGCRASSSAWMRSAKPHARRGTHESHASASMQATCSARWKPPVRWGS